MGHGWDGVGVGVGVTVWVPSGVEGMVVVEMLAVVSNATMKPTDQMEWLADFRRNVSKALGRLQKLVFYTINTECKCHSQMRIPIR